MKNQISFLVVGALLLGACATTKPVVPPVAQADPAFGSAAQVAIDADYTIGASDVLLIRTFREPDLSFDEIAVGESGLVAFPLIGSVVAEGLTAQQLADLLEARLASRYLQDPDVTVMVREINSRKVVVEGAVVRPGVFAVSNKTTLLEVIALAAGPTEIASLDDVVIFRTIDGQRMGALFDLREIRRGAMDDPALLPDDTVVVNYSNGRRLYQDLLRASPLIATVFRPVT